MKRKALHVVTAVTLLFSLPNVIFGQAPLLGTTRNFALFTAEGAFNNIGASTIVIGDAGTHVGDFNAFPPGTLVGNKRKADTFTAQAAADVDIAYMDLAMRDCDTVLGVTMGGVFPLTPRVYCTGGATTLNGNLTLDAQGDPDAIFIFQIGGAFATGASAQVLLINGANLCNVYWQVNGAFALGGSSLFVGTVIAEGAIDLAPGSVLNGRALSTAGAISTEDNTVTMSLCLAPSIICAGDVLVSCDDLVPSPDVASVSVTTTCPGAFSVTFEGDVVSNLNCTNQYTITRTYLVTDACGETATCAQTITVDDQIPPTITCPTDVAVSCLNLVPSDESASIQKSDNCGGTVTVSLLNDLVSGQVCPNNFTIARTYQALDACGITATCAQTITVNDQVPPTITCPIDVSVSCFNLVPSDESASILTSDNCGGTVTVSLLNDLVSGQVCPNNFTIARTYQALDACGITATCAQTITVNDQVPPTITCPIDVSVSCLNLAPLDESASIPTSDNCGGTVTVSLLSDVPTGQICPNIVTILRTYQALDACGITATCVQTITVNDQTLPVITCPPVTSPIQCATPVFPQATATDDCASNPDITFVDVTTPNPQGYSVTRTWTATDDCNNSAECSSTIVVEDSPSPTITCPTSVPNLLANANCQAILGDYTALVSPSNGCGGGPLTTVVQSPAAGTIVNPGTVAIHLTVSNTAGQSVECTFNVNISGGCN